MNHDNGFKEETEFMTVADTLFFNSLSYQTRLCKMLNFGI